MKEVEPEGARASLALLETWRELAQDFHPLSQWTESVGTCGPWATSARVSALVPGGCEEAEPGRQQNRMASFLRSLDWDSLPMCSFL